MTLKAENAGELILPPNFDEVLDVCLVEASELNAMSKNTEKYYVDGYPDLLVRYNPGDLFTDVQAAINAARQLRVHGVNVLPSEVIEHEGDTFVVTKIVTGSSAIDALQNSSDPTLIHEVDLTLTGITTNLVLQRNVGKLIPEDIDSPHQYVRGTIEDSSIPKLWLVDLPQYSRDPKDREVFADQCLYIANGIVDVEKLTGTPLLLARRELDQAVKFVDLTDPWRLKLKHAVSYVLELGVRLYPLGDAEEIDDLF